jgi:hypothetical protein
MEGGHFPMLDPGTMEILVSPLLTLEEIGGDLAEVIVTLRVNSSGVAHTPACRHVSEKAPPVAAMTVAAFRQAGPEWRVCRTCGGGVLQPLSAGQRERLRALVPLWESGLKREREATAARRHTRELARRADAVDQRARDIVHAWEWKLDKERRIASDYPAEIVSAAAPCDRCDTSAIIAFDPRALKVSFICPVDPEHGFVHMRDDQEPLAVWASGERLYSALALVAPVLAGGDEAWALTYAARATDYRRAIDAIEVFDRKHPEPMMLAPDVWCGDCGNRLSLHPAIDYGDGEGRQALYSCDVRHEDGKYRSHKKSWVDAEVDEELRRRLRDHPSWATAPELEPHPEVIATYAAHLTAKIGTYDEHIGAARADEVLARRRAELVDALEQITAIGEHGALTVAGLTTYATSHAYAWSSRTFTELARAFMTTRVEVTRAEVTVITRLDEDTPLYRSLRVREIREELTALRHRRQQLEAELAELNLEGEEVPSSRSNA